MLASDNFPKWKVTLASDVLVAGRRNRLNDMWLDLRQRGELVHTQAGGVRSTPIKRPSSAERSPGIAAFGYRFKG